MPGAIGAPGGGDPVLRGGAVTPARIVHDLAHALAAKGETEQAIALFQDLARLNGRRRLDTSFASARC